MSTSRMKTGVLLAPIVLLLVVGLADLLLRSDPSPRGPGNFADQGEKDSRVRRGQAPPEENPPARPYLAQLRDDTKRHGEVSRSFDEYLYSPGSTMGALPAPLDYGSDPSRFGEADDLPTQIYAFAERLRATGDEGVYAALTNTLYDPRATPEARMTVLTLFGWTATPQAVQALSNYLLIPNVQDEVRRVLQRSLQEAAYRAAVGPERREVASILARTWKLLPADLPAADQAVVTEGIAYLSTEEGAEALRSTLSAPDRGDDHRRMIARDALGQLQQNEAVPVLSSLLEDGGLDGNTAWAAITGLVSINSADAYSVVVKDLARHGAWDGHGLESLKQIMSEQNMPDEGIGVIRYALEKRTVQDTRVAEMLAEVLAIRARKEADGTGNNNTPDE